MEMTAKQWELVKELYQTALECSPAQRASFLEQNAIYSSDGTGALESSFLRVEGELALPLICDYLLPGRRFLASLAGRVWGIEGTGH